MNTPVSSMVDLKFVDFVRLAGDGDAIHVRDLEVVRARAFADGIGWSRWPDLPQPKPGCVHVVQTHREDYGADELRVLINTDYPHYAYPNQVEHTWQRRYVFKIVNPERDEADQLAMQNRLALYTIFAMMLGTFTLYAIAIG